MTPESTNNLDLLKSRMGSACAGSLEKAAKALAPGDTNGKEADRKRWKAALEFEGMFLSQMYKGMRQTTIGDDDELTKASPGREIFTEMLDNTYATMSAKNPLLNGEQGMQNAASGVSNSLAAQIYRSLSRQDGSGSGVLPPSIARISRPAPAESTAVGPVPSLSHADLKPIVDQAASKYGVSANLIRSVIKAESNNQPHAVSGAGAKGLMQLMDTTATDMGVRDVFNVEDNILGGTRYLKMLLERFGGDETKALAAYNAGPGTVERYNGVPPFRETKAYVEKILASKQALDTAAVAAVTAGE
ncbi:MAG: lytic transglycosylase domain-containing protein [Fibrobacteria bacterium]